MKYFKPSEFKCKCGCGAGEMDAELVTRLDVARGYAGVPFYITSGRRCAEHNADEGGLDVSAHVTGHAVDIRTTNSTNRMAVLRGVVAAGFKRIGIADNFIHVDTDPKKPQNVLWTY